MLTLVPPVRTQIGRDIRLALLIHTTFLVVFAVYAFGAPDSALFVGCSFLFLPQYVAFFITSGIESAQPTVVLVLRCIPALCFSFVFSLMYAAAWRSVAYLIGAGFSGRSVKAPKSI
jgi:uncharacterized membrane protein YhdT